jgi:putative drug exporter of the RND superfamily
VTLRTEQEAAAPPARRTGGRFLAELGRRVVLPLRWWILAVVGILVVIGGATGYDVESSLSTGGFVAQGSDSSQAADLINSRFAEHDSNLVLLVTARTGTVDDAAVAADGRQLTQRLAGYPELRAVSSYWSLGSAPSLRSSDGRQAVILANIPGDDNEVTRTIDRLSDRLHLDDDQVTVRVGGPGPVYQEIADRVKVDLRKAEALAFPLTGILLVLVFGTLIAPALPLGMGVIAVIGTIGALLAISKFASVSVYSLNLTTGLGLGLSIDYSLFMLSRFREERAAGRYPDEAIIETMRTAGRSVVFSGLTVAASLAALLVFPLEFLRSFAYAGIAVALLAVLSAVLVMPALLAVAGRWIERFPVLRRYRRGQSRTWQALVRAVMRRPVIYLVVFLALLGLLASPFRRAQLALPDDRVLPTSAQSRMVQDVLRGNFPDLANDPVEVVVPDGHFDAGSADLDRYAASLSTIRDVSRVDTVTGSYQQGQRIPNVPPGPGFAKDRGALVSVLTTVDSMSQRGKDVAQAVRGTPAPFPVLVGGRAAQLLDVQHALARGVPWALGLIAGVLLVALFLMFGSILLPIKALVLNTLSLSATFGAMVWIFQDGHLSGPLGFTATGRIDTTIPILMFCMAFGLSMDYEVFIMSRIKEAYDRGMDSDRAVVEGLSRTGGLVTAMAAILATVFVCFITSGVTFIKLMAVGLSTAVVMDATVVRGFLVPALMRLAGRWNWWAPSWLRRVHERYGISEA